MKIQKNTLCKNIALSTLLASSFAVGTAQADVLFGSDVELGLWFPDYDAGNFFNDVSGESQSIFASASFEHPIPVLPNAKISISQADSSLYEYTKIDYTGYYEVLDNDVVTIDVGAGISQFEDGEFLGLDFSVVTPHIYADAEVSLPLTNTTFYADFHYADIDGNQVTDFIAGVRYDLELIALDLGIKAGYRTQIIDTEDFDDLSFDIETDGFFLGVHADF